MTASKEWVVDLDNICIAIWQNMHEAEALH
jgi:hypothetical protein